MALTTPQTAGTLAAQAWPQSETSILRSALLALAGSLVLWLSAKIQVPFWPVPMTMQSFVVLFIGAAFGSRLGAATVLVYLAEAAAGLPVLAGTPERGIGVAYMMGPTGGYLVGYVVAAWLVGMLAERGWSRSIPLMVVAMFLGHVAMFVFGWAWLAYGMGLGAEKAWIGGVAPFYLATALKTLLAALAVPAAWQIVRR